MQASIQGCPLQYAQNAVEQCRNEYARIQCHRPVGLLSQLYDTFGLDENPRRFTPGPIFSSSSTDVGIHVHAEIERLASGEMLADAHPFTRKIVTLIRRLGWSVIAAEVPIVDETRNMFTRADLFLYDPLTRAVILVELKTGRDQGYGARLISRRAYLGLPTDVVDSQRARAHIQLAWMHCALKRKFPLLRLVSVVMVVNAERVRLEKLARWARIHCQLIYEMVAAKRAEQLAPRAAQEPVLSITSGQVHN